MTSRRWLVTLALLLLPTSTWAQSATVSASQNPCSLASSSSNCTSVVTWSSSGAPSAGLFFGSILVGGTPSGTYTPTWININGYTFDVRANWNDPNSQVLATVFVRGALPPQPGATINASPNPCTITAGNSSCTSQIAYASSNAPGAGLFFGTTLVGGGTSGTYTPTWITTGGYNFEVRLDRTNPNSEILTQVHVYGVTAVAPSATISATPNPCILATTSSNCSSAITWTSTNAPSSGLFYESTLLGAAASGSYSPNWLNVNGHTFDVRLDRNNPSSQILTSLFVSGVTANGSPSPASTVIGAIRWDGQGDFPAGSWEATYAAVEDQALSPSKYHFRLPFYATEYTATSAHIPSHSQATMDTEIGYARAAGIDYWAFDWYSGYLAHARNLYLASNQKNGLKWCAIISPDTNSMSTVDADALVGQFGSADYQKVVGGRPLLYAFSGNNPGLIDYISTKTNLLLGVKPYVVALAYDSGSASMLAGAINAQAISSYVTPMGGGASYATLSGYERSNWGGWASQTGLKVIPWVTQSWDPRPRIDIGYNLGFSYAADGWSITATPAELEAQVRAAITWNNGNPAAEAKAVLIYSWNEFSEGGFICPSKVPGTSSVNTDYVNAVWRALGP